MRTLIWLAASALTALAGVAEATAAPLTACEVPERWRTLPPTPVLPRPEREGHVAVAGSRLWYGEYGMRAGGTTVLLLHGGLGNSSYFGHLIRALANAGYRVVAVDSRGHGRSAVSSLPYSYRLMASDVVALLDHLRIAKADIVGWSDGGTIGYELAIDAPDRVRRLLAFGANATLDGLKPDYAATSTFTAYVARAGREHRMLAPMPADYATFLEAISGMWQTDPFAKVAMLHAIKTPVTIMIGQYDEALRIDHAEAIADAIPAANLVVLPNASHFAMLQCPEEFNDAVLQFLRWR